VNGWNLEACRAALGRLAEFFDQSWRTAVKRKSVGPESAQLDWTKPAAMER
jgi:hypothetical protein